MQLKKRKPFKSGKGFSRGTVSNQSISSIRLFFFWLFSFWLFLFQQPLMALEGVELLPQGVNMMAMKSGNYVALDTHFTAQNELISQTELHSVSLSQSYVSKFEPRVQELAHVLNQFGQYGLGDQLDMGYLEIKIHPTVTYFAPVYAYGITNSWTVGAAMPLVHYRNEISIDHSGSNIDSLKKELSGISPQIDSAFKQMEFSGDSLLQDTLSKKGYQRLESVDKTIYGDMMVFSRYKYLSTLFWPPFRKVLNKPNSRAFGSGYFSFLFNRWVA